MFNSIKDQSTVFSNLDQDDLSILDKYYNELN